MTNDHTPAFGLLSENEGASLALSQALFSLRPLYVTLEYIDDGDVGQRSSLTAATQARYRVIVRDCGTAAVRCRRR